MEVVPIGYIRKTDRDVFIEILDEFLEGLEGLEEGMWIKVIAWLHKSDTWEKRRILKVHPRGDKRNPIRGVFATRSPVRPNPFGLYTVFIEKIERNKLYISWIDAYDNTPVLDIRPFVERLDCPADINLEEYEYLGSSGRVDVMVRRSEHLDELEEVSPEEYVAAILEINGRSVPLSARDIYKLAKLLNKILEELPVEIKDKLGI
ncbi:tRNA (N6-threonylcarbamoyladenosine(37)-N6)-methyltransferase TrmO [Pyrococcus furiosus DSM 3638]|uniref:TsaA-like domain-containing protein n=3 Tax=Pyrococcus furiosus TaxID=2261 RepID=Q8U4E3_PYRFU|nr:tRNA (N6-threonylcarbamoyladenosine(37)-N6)-methyltransferase TrmO [Pyrococcus furiosus]AAL80269.1 hypothetical protein PF0145 [Pyrococcus furiosus DSM 3638]AFN04431.1 hypothetical protein PFC_07475 [Pyrococcus furiosus COM1]QEK77875.1 tRNA (N6-threonylcarbamoyladenosine(37)-N6)-methyltransferase TrmO [Pyrococcus furiosus DSM 3638]